MCKSRRLPRFVCINLSARVYIVIDSIGLAWERWVQHYISVASMALATNVYIGYHQFDSSMSLSWINIYLCVRRNTWEESWLPFVNFRRIKFRVIFLCVFWRMRVTMGNLIEGCLIFVVNLEPMTRAIWCASRHERVQSQHSKLALECLAQTCTVCL